MEQGKHLIFPLLLVFVSVVAAFSDETTAIGTILANPNSFHLKTVNMRGTAMKIRAIDPAEKPNYLGRRVFCPGAFSLTLDDGTGALEVKFLGDCDAPTTIEKRPIPVSEGDSVLIQARIQAPSIIHGGVGSRPTNIYGEEQDIVFAVANAIRPAR